MRSAGHLGPSTIPRKLADGTRVVSAEKARGRPHRQGHLLLRLICVWSAVRGWMEVGAAAIRFIQSFPRALPILLAERRAPVAGRLRGQVLDAGAHEKNYSYTPTVPGKTHQLVGVRAYRETVGFERVLSPTGTRPKPTGVFIQRAQAASHDGRQQPHAHCLRRKHLV